MDGRKFTLGFGAGGAPLVRYFNEIIFGSPIGPNIPEGIELIAKELIPAIREMAS